MNTSYEAVIERARERFDYLSVTIDFKSDGGAEFSGHVRVMKGDIMVHLHKCKELLTMIEELFRRCNFENDRA